MDLADFAAKIDWEGGTSGAVSYGLRSSDLDEDVRIEHPELVIAWDNLVAASREWEVIARELLPEGEEM